MGEILDMARHKARKLDCQGETVDLRQHFANGPDTPERRTSAAAALARCVAEINNDFGPRFAMECLANEVMKVRMTRR